MGLALPEAYIAISAVIAIASRPVGKKIVAYVKYVQFLPSQALLSTHATELKSACVPP